LGHCSGERKKPGAEEDEQRMGRGWASLEKFVEHVTFDLRVGSSSPTLDVEAN